MSTTTMHTRPCISVIVAVYNVEEYIAQCCHSLFSQTLENMEYVFIDDCSPDNSMTIVKSTLEHYPNRAHQVCFINHPHNLGLTQARASGIRAASGEFIIYCDPDDWVEPNMYEELYSKAVSDNADIVLSDLYYNSPGDPKSYYGKEEPPKELTSQSVLAACMCAQRPILHCFLVNKLIRADYYKTVEWPQSISRYEDIIAFVQILTHPVKISYVNKAFYHYLQRDGSLLHRQYTKDDIENDYTIILLLQKYLCDNEERMWGGRHWQAFVPVMMMATLRIPYKAFSNKEYAARYRQYRNCIWKNKSLSFGAKTSLFCATYNYTFAFALFKLGKQVSALLHG